MRFTGLPAAGMMVGIAFGFWGLWPQLGPAIPADPSPMEVVAQKPVIPNSPLDRSLDDGPTSALIDVSNTNTNHPQQGTNLFSAEAALRDKVLRLTRGQDFLRGVTDYCGKLQKQEVVKGELLDEQTIVIKCRHNPFSVYLVWLTGDAGREVLYLEGQNNGKMIAHDGGWKARIPALTISTEGMLAMRDARYPVTTAGLLGLIEIMLGIHQEDLNWSKFSTCEIESNHSFDGRPCDQYTTRYKSAQDSPVYRKSITLIDLEWNVPLHSRHFEWPKAGTVLNEKELDEATLIESYSFTEIRFRCNLTDRDFDRANPEYRFR